VLLLHVDNYKPGALHRLPLNTSQWDISLNSRPSHPLLYQIFVSGAHVGPETEISRYKPLLSYPHIIDVYCVIYYP